MIPLKKIFFSLILGTLIFSVTACEREGPMEEAGEKIDETVEETGEKIKDATN